MCVVLFACTVLTLMMSVVIVRVNRNKTLRGECFMRCIMYMLRAIEIVFSES